MIPENKGLERIIYSMVDFGSILMASQSTTPQSLHGLGTTSTTSEVHQMAGVIQEFGITTVICAVFLIFTIVLLVNTIKRSNSMDGKMKDTLNEVAGMVRTVRDSSVNLAKSFDNHNTKFVMEIDKLKNGLDNISKLCENTDDKCGKNQEAIREIQNEITELRRTINNCVDVVEKMQSSIRKMDDK